MPRPGAPGIEIVSIDTVSIDIVRVSDPHRRLGE